MKIINKTAEEVEIMAEGGRRLADVMRQVAAAVKPGVTTRQLDAMAEELILAAGGEPAFKGFDKYPASTCISVNNEVVHGLPGERVLKDSDVVGIDIGMRYHGFCTDHAVTVPVGKVSHKAQELLAVTEESLRIGLTQVKPGNRIGDISFAIQQSIMAHDFGIVRDLTGHGIGRSLHEEPSIPNFGKPGTGPVLEVGMVLAIEPMVTLGSAQVIQADDGWAIVTVDGSLAAHFEHTVAVTKDGCRTLTV